MVASKVINFLINPNFFYQFCDMNPTKKLTIAIDGYSSCGKSTFAKRIARELGYVYIDSGAMYRAVTLYGLDHKLVNRGKVDIKRHISALDEISITFVKNETAGFSEV